MKAKDYPIVTEIYNAVTKAHILVYEAEIEACKQFPMNKVLSVRCVILEKMIKVLKTKLTEVKNADE